MGWIGCVRFRIILTWPRGTNFWTNSGRFALSFVRQPNGSECTQIVRNAPKHQFSVQWGGSGAFVATNSDATSCTNFCTRSARFAPSFVSNQTVQNAPKLYETHQNISLGSNGVDHMRWLQKITTRHRGPNFCINYTSSVCLATNAPNPSHWTLN